MEQVILVATDFGDRRTWQVEDLLRELDELTRSAGGRVIGQVVCRRQRPTPAYFIGKGKAQEIRDMCLARGADIVVFNDDLFPAQQRNLEEIIGVKTIDRTQLILDIFAQRAHSSEGKVQVEMAQLMYLLPRLTGRGILLSRLGGGIGTRGPGEKKLEVDRRRIRERIAKLKEDLAKIGVHRATMRKSRDRVTLPVVGIVGYTNSGKSTLLNALTGSKVGVGQVLFATLDPTIRRLSLLDNREILFADTVGFLHRLPLHLIEAFKATLDEVVRSDILIHVLDISHPMVDEQYGAVGVVLDELGIRSKPCVVALNKVDKVENPFVIRRFLRRFPNSVAISALRRDGLDELVGKVVITLETPGL